MAHAARTMEFPVVLPKSVAYDHVVYGRGKFEYSGKDTMLTLVKVSAFAEPIGAENVVQHTVGDTTYVVSETVGFLNENVLDDAEFWDWIGDDEGVAIVAKEEGPHTGITCEYTGEELEEPWYQVMWTDSFDEPFTYEGAWEGLNGFVDFVNETHDEENGWMLRMANVTLTRFDEEEGAPAFRNTTICLHERMVIDTSIREWGPYGPSHEFTNAEDYTHDWYLHDDEDENSPIEQFNALLKPDDNHGIADVSGFASFVREDFSGSFIVSIDRYEG